MKYESVVVKLLNDFCKYQISFELIDLESFFKLEYFVKYEQMVIHKELNPSFNCSFISVSQDIEDIIYKKLIKHNLFLFNKDKSFFYFSSNKLKDVKRYFKAKRMRKESGDSFFYYKNFENIIDCLEFIDQI